MRCVSEAAALLAGTLLVGGCGAEAPVQPAPPPPAPVAVAADVPTEAEAAAHLAAKQGDVRWQTPSADAWRGAPLGQPFSVGDQVQTMEDATASVRMKGPGADVELAPQTVLRIPPQDDMRRVRHVSGRLRARLDPAEGESRLEVSLPPGDLVLTASPGDDIVDSQIDVDEERTEVAMLRGRGVLRRRDLEPVLIADGEYAQLEEDGALLDRGVDLPAPELEATPPVVRTRGMMRLAWKTVEGAAGYRVTFLPEGDESSVLHETDVPEGTFRVAAGDYRYELRALDALGRAGHPATSSPFRVEVDRVPPPLDLASPRSGVVMEGPVLHVAGTTEPTATLTLDGQSVPVAADGAFDVQRSLPTGVSNLVLRARDDVGNVSVVTRQIVRAR